MMIKVPSLLIALIAWTWMRPGLWWKKWAFAQLRSGCLGSDSLFQSSKLHLVWSWWFDDFDVPEEGPGSMKWWWNPLKSSALVAWQEVFHDLKTGDGTRWDGSTLGALGRRTAWEFWLTSMTATTCWTEELPATMSSNYIVTPQKIEWSLPLF